MTIAGTFIGLQYSIPPFKFKSRGILQFFCLWGIIFFGPMLYTSIITNGIPATEILLFFTLFGIHQMSIILFNTAEDYIEDLNDGLNTIVISLGLHRTLNLAWWMILTSGILLHFISFYFYSNLENPYLYTAIGIYTLGWLLILFEAKQILIKTRGLNNKETTDILKKNGMKVPRWLKVGAYTILLVIGIYVFNSILI